MFDITLLTEIRYLAKSTNNRYLKNILEEDAILGSALERRGLKVFRTNWDNNSFDWNTSRYVIFRTTWDYFNRIKEFNLWLKETQKRTQFINKVKLIKWNIDKHYLHDLAAKGINIPPTIFIEKGDTHTWPW